jgi:hypothetical protein
MQTARIPARKAGRSGIVGTLHGAFFLVLVSLAIQVLIERSLAWGRLARVVGLSFLPFGFLLADRFLRDAAAAGGFERHP